MNDQEILCYFKEILKDGTLSAGIAGIRTMLEIVSQSNAGTVSGLRGDLMHGVKVLKQFHHPIAAVISACELFVRHVSVSLATYEMNITKCKEIVLDRGAVYLKQSEMARSKVCKFAKDFIGHGSKILTHSRSRVVLQAMQDANAMDKEFEVFVTKSAPDDSGERMYKELTAAGIKCTLILDSAVAYIMEQIDFVMVGAEGVVESGGIINKIGTYTIGMCALELRKPFYVLVEEFKFSRLFPLNQLDLPDEYKYPYSELGNDLKRLHPLVDYTPPKYITMLFTDRGVLTTAAVEDVLIKLYL